ncbi:MAG: phospholipase [Chloroflexota bacterium]|nr:phospholipase [Chloroflexota bacterium]
MPSPLRYLWYPPTNADSPTPLILFLHGVGERGDDLELVKRHSLPRFLEEGGALPAFVCVPQCPDGERWEDVLDALDAMLDHLLATQPIDPDRVYLTGFSLGSYGTWSWAIARPDRFAALMPVGGNGLRHSTYTFDQDFEAIQHLTVWMIHSAGDMTVRVDGADFFAARMTALKMNFGYTRYPHLSHGGTADAAFWDQQHYDWLLAQRRETR